MSFSSAFSASSSSPSRRGRGDQETSSLRGPHKVVLIGPSASGKTALRRRFVRGDFVDNYRASIGTDFVTKRVAGSEEDSDDATAVELSLWDTAGQERFKSIAAPFYRGAEACVLAFDYTTVAVASDAAERTVSTAGVVDPALRAWFEEFRDRCDTVRDCAAAAARRGQDDARDGGFCWVVVGCKSDLVTRDDRVRIDRAVRKEVKAWWWSSSSNNALRDPPPPHPPPPRDLIKKQTTKDGVERIDFNDDDSTTVKNKKKKPKTKLLIGPRPIKPIAAAPTAPEGDDDGGGGDGGHVRRPPLTKTPSTTSTLASVELSSSIPNPQTLNPRSLLLMSTSPPRPPASIDPLGGHPHAVYEGGPFTLDGRLLDDQSEHREDGIERARTPIRDEPLDGTGPDGAEEEEGGGGEEDERDDDDDDDDGFKLFSTSAKTGQGVDEV